MLKNISNMFLYKRYSENYKKLKIALDEITEKDTLEWFTHSVSK